MKNSTVESKLHGGGEAPSVGDGPPANQIPTADATDERDEDEPEVEPKLDAPYYCLSEAGEGAMAWEATLQSMFPGVRSFWNRLLNDGRSARHGEKVFLLFMRWNMHVLCFRN